MIQKFKKIALLKYPRTQILILIYKIKTLIGV